MCWKHSTPQRKLFNYISKKTNWFAAFADHEVQKRIIAEYADGASRCTTIIARGYKTAWAKAPASTS